MNIVKKVINMQMLSNIRATVPISCNLAHWDVDWVFLELTWNSILRMIVKIKLLNVKYVMKIFTQTKMKDPMIVSNY